MNHMIMLEPIDSKGFLNRHSLETLMKHNNVSSNQKLNANFYSRSIVNTKVQNMIQRQKIQKMEELAQKSKGYLAEYNKYQFKIDSAFNNAYHFIRDSPIPVYKQQETDIFKKAGLEYSS